MATLGASLTNTLYRQKSDRVTTIAHANPFSFAVGSAPALDWLLSWRLNFSFDLRHSPPAETYLGDATLLMVPLIVGIAATRGFDSLDALLGMYKDYLRAYFHELASTDTWALYRRNSDYELFQNSPYDDHDASSMKQATIDHQLAVVPYYQGSEHR